MAENRLTYHNGYRDKNGKPYGNKHNQREGFEKPKNADKNEYWDYQIWGTESFSQSEKMLYKYAFRDFVKTHNEKCKKRGQYARCITVEQYREKHPPEETLLYLGTENVNVEALKATFEDFREWIKQECNTDTCGIELLNAALHMDEATPHIQFRKVYWYTDKDGNAQVSQTKALEGLGYKRPDPMKPNGRYNNVKMTFDAVCRAKLIEIAKSHGVELETKPLPKDQVGLSIDEYRAREQAREVWKEEQKTLCAEKEKLEQAIEQGKQELGKIRENMTCEVQELGGLKAYNALKKAERDEKAKQEAEREAQKERERQEKIAAERERMKQETQEYTQTLWNAPETSESIEVIPDTPKQQTPLKNASRTSEAYTALKKSYNALNENGEPTDETKQLLSRLGIST